MSINVPTGALSRRAALAFLLALAVSIGVAFSGCSAAQEQEKQDAQPAAAKLAIVHTNDVHGYDIAAEPTDSAPGVIGLAAVPQLVKDYESQGYEVLLLDAGDAIQDTSLVNLSHGATAIDFMNTAGYQAMALGNHEFDWGADNLEALRNSAKFPFLSANVIVESTGKPLVDPHAVFTMKSGLKVGVFALTTVETKTKSNPKNVVGLTFLAGEDMYRCAQDQVDELKAQGCDVIVCLGHLGSVGGVAPNRSIDVLENTKGIDVFIDGHDHKVVNETVGGGLLASTGCHLENIGVVLYEEGAFSEHLVEYGTYDGKDKVTEDVVNKADAEVKQQLSATIGTTEVALDGNRDPGVRTQETNLGDFAADALLWQAQQAAQGTVDAAIVNGGSIRDSIGVGAISMDTLLTVFPYQNSLNIVTVKGSVLLEVLEAATFCLPEAAGSFPQVAGITYSVNTGVEYENGDPYPESTYYAPKNPGARVTISDVGGRGFSLDEEYTFAASSFITAGGDTYYPVAAAYNDNGYTTGYSDTDALINYVNTELGGVIGSRYASPLGRISVN